MTYYGGKMPVRGIDQMPGRRKGKHPDFGGDRRRKLKRQPCPMPADGLSGCGCFEEDKPVEVKLEWPEIDNMWLIGAAIVVGLFFFKK